MQDVRGRNCHEELLNALVHLERGRPIPERGWIDADEKLEDTWF